MFPFLKEEEILNQVQDDVLWDVFIVKFTLKMLK